jgi:hypothetical protein
VALGDPLNETRERFTTTVYNIEVEDWHTHFVSELGLWVHNTNCADATLSVNTTLDTVDALIKDAVQMGSQGAQFDKLTRAELSLFLKDQPDKRDGFAIIRMYGVGKYKEFELGDVDLPRGLAFEAGGLGRLIGFGNTATTTTMSQAVILPFLKRPEGRGYAAKANFCFGVMPPMAILGRS